MTPRVISLAILSILVLAASLLAKPYDPERSAPQGDYKNRKELAPQERMHMRKHMKHKMMAKEFRHEAMRHREMARMHKRELMGDNCPQGFDCPNGPQMRRERMHKFRNDNFSPNFDRMGPPPHFRRQIQMEREQLGAPPMNPDQPMGPPQHMRFREGKKGPRAL